MTEPADATTPIPVRGPDGVIPIQGLDENTAKPRPDVEFTLNRQTGEVSIKTPNGVPEAVTMPFHMLQGVVDDLNLWRELANKQQIVTAALNLGQRPNAEVRARVTYLLQHFGVQE